MKNIKKFIIYSLFIGCLFFIGSENVFAKSCKIEYTNNMGEIDYIYFNSYSPWHIMIYQYKNEAYTRTHIKYDTTGKNFTYVGDGNSFYKNISFVNGSLSFDSNGIIKECPYNVSISGDWGDSITFDMKYDSNSNIYVDDELIENEYENNGVIDPNKKPVAAPDFDLCGFTVKVLNWVRMLIPIVIILLSSMDFFKVVFANEDDAMKKAYGKLVKRLLIAAIIFLVPTLLQWLIKGILPEIFDNWFVEWCPSIK